MFYAQTNKIMLKIKAKFIGRNSRGYQHNLEYVLHIAEYGGMSVRRTDGTGYCPYQSLSAFLRNWTNIITLEKP